MLRDITIGQYFPVSSPMHRLDPRVKMVLTVLYIVALFLPKTWVGLALSVVLLAVAYALARIPFSMVVKSVRPILLLVTLTAALNLFYNKEGVVLFQWWIFTVTDSGLAKTAFIIVRILCLIVGSSLLTYTTTPTALTDAIERLLSPLKAVRLNVHELAMMMTIALRFIPTLIEETDKIMSAQKARGADMESGGLVRRIRALLPVLIPLFASSFRRAYELALAMECRCYRGGEGRTRMKQLRMALRDGVALLVMAVAIALLIGLNSVFPKVI
ncbi:MAG: energy-coupling factor transporter transmembrane protein EcfT [Ruminococcaceae bacterium]|nr:energy-coupling factor transporter transmembrane protein EcfT [Oscillospiraceae bacterium]